MVKIKKKLMDSPEFWDVFGIFVWIFLIAAISRALYFGVSLSQEMIVFILAIAILGLVVDGYFVLVKLIKQF